MPAIKIRIYYYHTDAGGVVYYANYLKFLEEARTEFFSERGISIKDLAGAGTLFVVARQEIDYNHPAFYGDLLSVSAEAVKSTNVRIEFAHKVTNQDNKLIAEAKTTLACVGADLKPKPIPKIVKEKLS